MHDDPQVLIKNGKYKELNNDVAMSMRYVINTMKQIGFLEVVGVLEDIALYVENYQTMTQDTTTKQSEHESLIACYMVTKYAKKITLDKHKQTALLDITNILQKNADTI